MTDTRPPALSVNQEVLCHLLAQQPCVHATIKQDASKLCFFSMGHT